MNGLNHITTIHVLGRERSILMWVRRVEQQVKITLEETIKGLESTERVCEAVNPERNYSVATLGDGSSLLEHSINDKIKRG